MTQSKAIQPPGYAYTPERLEYNDGYQPRLTIWVETLSERDIQEIDGYTKLHTIQIDAQYVHLDQKSIELLDRKFYSKRKDVCLRFYHFIGDTSVFRSLKHVEIFNFAQYPPELQKKQPYSFNCEFLQDIHQLKKLELDIYSTDDIAPLKNLTNLSSLTLRSTKKSKASLQSLASLPLQDLSLSNFNDIASLPNIPSLRSLSIVSVKFHEKHSEAILRLKNLKSFFCYYHGIQNLDFLEFMPFLKELSLKTVGNDHLDFVSSMTGLEHLDLSYASGIRKLPSLKNLKNLKKITLYRLLKLEDISSLAEAKNLEHFTCSGMVNKNFTPKYFQKIFCQLSKLRSVNLHFYDKNQDEEYQAMMKKMGIEIVFTW